MNCISGPRFFIFCIVVYDDALWSHRILVLWDLFVQYHWWPLGKKCACHWSGDAVTRFYNTMAVLDTSVLYSAHQCSLSRNNRKLLHAVTEW